MLIGVAGLTGGFLVGGVLLVAVLGVMLQSSVDSAARQTADDVAALVDAGEVPQPLPVSGGDLVQVVDGSGRVRAASGQADRLVSMVHGDDLAKVRAGHALFLHGDVYGLDGPIRVVGTGAGPANDPQTVLVARSMSDALRGASVLRNALLILFPILVLGLALLAWRVIGATLRPVEELRRGAEDITGTARAGRLPVPASNDEIRRLAVTLNGMIGRLEAGRARQREFVADAAHELRSPLTNMRTQLEVAQHLGPAADWPAVADDLLTDTARLSRLVDDLLLLARSDESPRLTRPEPVAIDALVRTVGARYPGVSVEVDDSPLWTLGDEDALARVLANLLDNAARHARTSVVVTAARAGDRILVAVTDDGPGIPEADRERVFERFTRLDDARARDAGGAGLGLAIVRELVRRHGGTVRLRNAPSGAGLRVDVILPAEPGTMEAATSTDP